MKTDRAIQDEIRAALDRRLAGVVEQPDSQQKMLRLVRGEDTKMKKKLSAGFALGVALVLMAAVALAVASITQTGRLMAQNEQESGDYIHWPTAQKVQVVMELMDAGCLTENGDLARLRAGGLSEAEEAEIADAAIETITGEPAENASFLSIMNALWGPFEQWTQEQQAWYSQVLADVGAPMEGKTRYTQPDGGMSAEEAAAIARREIARGFGMADGQIDLYRAYEVSFQIPEFAEAGSEKAYWYVALEAEGTEEPEGLPAHVDVFVDPDTGLLLEPIEEKAAAWKEAAALGGSEAAQTVRAFLAECAEEKAFPHWSLENKARWSREVAPVLRAALAENPEQTESVLSLDQLASLDFQYALPGEDALPQAQALAIARETVRETYALSAEEMALLFDTGDPYYTCAFYDATDEARPLWKFLLLMPGPYASDEAIASRVKALGDEDGHGGLYKVEIDARTGEVVRVAHIAHSPVTLEAYRDIL